MYEPPFTPAIPALIARMTRDFGDREALVGGARRLTFRELDAESAALSRGLLAAGVGKGVRVGILMPNSPDWAVVFLAITRIGAVCVPLSTLYQAPELRWVARHADLHTLFVADRYRNHDYLSRLEEAFPELADRAEDEHFLRDAPFLRRIYVWGDCDRAWARRAPQALLETAARASPALLTAAEAQVVPADLLVMIYTSGSTADPKGVVHTHGAVVRHTWQVSHHFWLLGEGDRIASLRPYFWVAGLSSTLLYSLQTGACLVTPPSEQPLDLLETIRSEAITAVTGSAALFAAVASNPQVIASGYTVLRLAIDTAAVAYRPTPETPYRFVNPRIEGLSPASGPPIPADRMASTFGMTETLAGHTTLPALTLLPEAKAGAAGHPLPGVTLKVVDPVTREPRPTGQFGELLVRGYLLMDGFYKKERAETFAADGFYPTGDLCAIDGEGVLRFQSRLGEMLKIKGANVAPLEVERALTEIAGVQEAAVVGLPGPDGPRLAAAIAPLPGAKLDPATIEADLRGRLSSYKVPRLIFLISADDLPRTGSGKIRKPALVKSLVELADAAQSPHAPAAH